MSARSEKALFLAVLAIPLLGGGAQAALTWNNSGYDFNASASWTGTLAANQTAGFPSSPSKQPNLSANFSMLGVSFPSTTVSGYDITATSPFALTLTTTTTTATSGAISGANTTGTNIIDAPLILGAGNGATQSFYQAPGGILVVNGAISSTNSVSLKITGTTSTTKRSVVTLAGANSYSGGTTLDGVSTLNINNGGTGGTSSSLGTGDFIWSNGGIVDNTSGSRVTLSTNKNVTLSGITGTYVFTGSDDLNFGSGTVAVNNSVLLRNNSATGKTLTFGSLINNKTGSGISLSVYGASNAPVVFGGFTLNNMGNSGLTHTVSGTGSVKFAGVISDGNVAGNSLTYKGTGLLQLEGANTYTGNTVIDSGTVQLDGSTTGQGNFVVQTGTGATVAPKLTGTGTIGLASGKSLLVMGGYNGASVPYLATVAPGDTSTTSATLSVGTDSTNKVTFGDSSVLAIDINADATDELAITGDLDLSSTSDKLLINTTGEQSLAHYVFATYSGSLTSTFAIVTYNGGSLPGNLTIDYLTNHEIALVNLDIIPEPVGISLLLGIAGAGLLRRRRSRRA